MRKDIAELLFRPDIFFEQRNREPVSLLVPAIIVGTGGAVSFLSPLIERAVINHGDISNFIMEPSAAIFFLVVPFIIWFIVAGILFVFGRLLSGTGSFFAMLQNCGYGYLPNTLLSPFVIISSIALAWSAGTSSVILTWGILFLGTFSFLSIFWSGWLWAIALEKTHSLSRGNAMAGAAVVLLLYLSVVILNSIAHFRANGFP